MRSASAKSFYSETAPVGQYLLRVARRRIDTLLAERGLARSRSSAAESVRAGRVRIGRDGPLATKPSELVHDGVELRLDEGPAYVSRGGTKLENALDALRVDVAGRRCLDVGASTGGFTDCLLQRGAAHVIALDVGYGQLEWSLRNDARVTVMERFNARELTPDALAYEPGLVTVDVSFISLAKVLPALAACLAPDGEILAMVKPQFELGRADVGRGGVVRSAATRRRALVSIAELAPSLGLRFQGFAPSGLPGPKGNRETFAWFGHGEAVARVEAAALGVDPDGAG
jgi:23S rRNA (cytidine1920-2'-O)/16S rRNA (cytidine1409-2'-O)-methyltransferase